jgi:hypothetical protein
MKKYILTMAVAMASLATYAQDMSHMQHMQKDTTPKKKRSMTI